MDGLRRGTVVRLPAAAGGVLAVVAGLAVRAAAGGDLAKYAGDALYTVLVYALVVLVAPRVRPVRAAVVAAGVSWLVELFQATGLPEEWGRRSGLVHLVLGSTFNPPDLFWYLVGAGCAGALHRVLRTSRVAAAGGAA
ncbi:DUF2809 domain-containing protein [Kitasatospora sp. NPDC058444]|uniref:DUF2809 domain-containing protein n=1 Tax=Kitasatospora sp. NPDC058444 TaxID=3346504 RepID=UPI00365A1FB1